MTLLRRFFSKRPPDGLLEFVERVYVFDSCFSTEVLPLEMYSIYLHGISNELHEEFPESSFLAFNFREGEKRSLFAEILCEYDITVLDYPRQYEGCPLLPLSLIQHFLHVCDSWLSRSNQQNIILLHCERGGWPVLAFLLASFLIFRKLHSGERRTLELVHREAPKGLLQLLSPLNPLPSQLRYLQYVSRRNIAPEWPPPERALSLDCIILRSIPSFDLQNGCRPVIRIYGNNLQRNDGLSTDMLFSMCKKRKSLRYYRQAECDIIKIDIQCLVRGDVVLEVVHLDLDSERELMMFRVMFNTAFIRSNILMLNSGNLDILWDSKERYPKGFCAEVLFGDVESISSSLPPTTILNGEEKGGLPIEAFSRVQELFSGVDWIDNNDDAALWLIKRLSALNDAKELSRLHNRGSYYASSVDSEEESNAYSATDSSDEASDTIYKPWSDQTQSSVVDPISAFAIPVEVDRVNHTEISSVTSEQNILQVPSKEAHQSTSPHLLAIDHVSSRPPPPAPSVAAAEVSSMSPQTACDRSMALVLGPTNALPYDKSEDATTPSLSHLPLPPAPPPPPPLPSYGPSRNSQMEAPTTSKIPPTPPPLPCSSGCSRASFQNSSVCDSFENINKSLSTSQPLAPPPPPPPPLLPTTSKVLENKKLESSLLVTNSPLPTSTFNSSKGPPPPPPPPPPNTNNHSSLRVVTQPPPPPPPPSTRPTFLANTQTAPPPPCPPSSGLAQLGSVSVVRQLASKVPTAPPPPPIPSMVPGPPPPPPIPSKVPGAPPPPPIPYMVPGPPPPPPIPSKVPGPPPPPPTPFKVPSAPPPPPLLSKVPTAPAPPRASKVPPIAPPPPSGVPPPPPNAPKVPIAPPPANGLIAGSTSDSGVKSDVPPPPLPSVGKGKTLTMSGRARASLGATNAPKKASLKPLHWVKVTRAVQGSLWADSQKQENQSRAPEIDMSELEKYFSAASLADGAGSNKLGTRPSSNMNKPEKVQLVDLNRAKNCEIMLTKIKIPLPSMVNAILALDSSVLDIDQVENLIKFCPTKEEMGLLKNYTGDKEMLGKCEKFFLELMKVPRVESKLRVFAFRITFSSQVDDLRSNLNTINFAVKEVKESVKLRQIMQTILTLGNALNQGTARGSAVGFKLDSLLKLSDTRARNNKMTLMHYLSKLLSEKLPELLDFEKDLIHLEPASKIQLKTLAEEMQAVSKGLEKVEQELAASESDGAISAGFQKVLKNFLDTAEAEVRSLIGLYSEVGRNADSLSQYFGEDPARCPFEQVTQILAVFVKTFNKAREENERLAEAEKKKMEKEALKERSMGTKKGAADTHELDLSSHLRKHAHSIQSEKHAS